MAASRIRDVLEHPDFKEGVCWRRRPFRTNEALVVGGQLDLTVYLIERGAARVVCDVVLDGDRRMRPGIWEVKAGDIVGELAVFDDRPRAASVVGVADGEAIAIDGAALRRFLDEHPELGYGVLREILTSLVERLRASNQRLETVFAWGLRARGIDRHL